MNLDRWRRHWRSWRRLDGPARRRLLQAACILPGVALGVRLFGYKRTRGLLARLSPPPTAEPPDLQPATAELAWAVAVAAHHAPFATTCLQRSLTLWWLLRRRRIASELRIGVTKADGEFRAHAWLERDGAVLNDDVDVGSRFAAFDALPDNGSSRPNT